DANYNHFLNKIQKELKPHCEILAYCLMPNHFHLILEIDSQKVKGQEIKIKSLSSLMGAMKTTSSSSIHKAGFDSFEWHRSFHDHIIRSELAYLRISNYIDNNPQKWFQDKFHSKA
ncbi:MAG: transposase, partial [Flavobacteriaceae bacterium]|nr:transposase [Flavobacteriaceae bacterium]